MLERSPLIPDCPAPISAPAPFAGLPLNHYRAIAIDPPSYFKARTALQVANWNSRRDVEKHYPTMSFEQLAALPVARLAAADGCHLFLWTSGPFLPQALQLMEAWGFRYSTRAFTWVKAKRSAQLAFLSESDLHVGLGLTVPKITPSAAAGATWAARFGSTSTASSCISGSICSAAILPKACACRVGGKPAQIPPPSAPTISS